MYRTALLAALVALAPASTSAQTTDMEMTPEPAAAAEAITPNRANTESRVSPNALASQTFGTTTATVQYGRPAVRDREIFGGLVPFGEVWRTGANEAATLTVSDDVLVGGEPLAAGTYALFFIPGEETWTVVLNGTAEQWGAFNYDVADDALRAEVIAETGRPVQEQMLMLFEEVGAEGATLVLAWDDVRIPVRITLP